MPSDVSWSATDGWRLREGSIATPTGGVGGPQPPGGIGPIYDYPHGTGQDEGNSVIGGYVYRGPIAALRGRYFLGDFVNPRIWSLRVDRDTSTVSEFVDWTDAFRPDVGSIDSIVSFGEDGEGNLYVVDFHGEIFRLDDFVAAPTLGPLGLGCARDPARGRWARSTRRGARGSVRLHP